MQKQPGYIPKIRAQIKELILENAGKTYQEIREIIFSAGRELSKRKHYYWLKECGAQLKELKKQIKKSSSTDAGQTLF